jgi:hypothetical protein
MSLQKKWHVVSSLLSGSNLCIKQSVISYDSVSFTFNSNWYFGIVVAVSFNSFAIVTRAGSDEFMIKWPSNFARVPGKKNTSLTLSTLFDTMKLTALRI